MMAATRVSKLAGILLGLAVTLAAGLGHAQISMGTAFTYQGSLNDGSNPASGDYDFQFMLWDDPLAGTQQGPTIQKKLASTVNVAGGVFNVTLDFGNQFAGNVRFLEVSVRPYDATDTAPYTLLTPRQELKPVPYAMFADAATTATNSNTVGGMTAGQLQDDRPPVVVLEADRFDVLIGSPISAGAVNFNLSLSYDPEGGALTYGFDPTGSQAGQPTYGGSATASYAYTLPGTYVAEGWVRDGASQYALDKVTISVQAGGFQGALDTTGDVGHFTSLAVVNGNPAISYWDQANTDLKYVRATDASGTAWGAPVAIDTAGTVGQYTSLAVVNGFPAISYYDIGNGDLKYVRATDASGTAWGAPVAIDTAGIVGNYTSLAVVNGFPAISYFDNTNFALKYVRATDASGMAWGAPVAVDTGGAVGYFTSLAVVNGSPAISYWDGTNIDLKYVRATDASGTAWGARLAIDTAGNVGYFTSLAVVNGSPAISYFDLTNGNLKYVRATNATGALLADWGAPVAPDTAGIVGWDTSLAVVDGNPAISYHDLTNLNLKYVRATNATGALVADWGAPVAADTAGDVGQWTSLEVVNGYPAISYHDATNQDLKYLR